MKKWIYIVSRFPFALLIAYRTYKLHMIPQHKIAWKNAKGFFKLTFAWKK